MKNQLLNELNDLFEFAEPRMLRRSVEELFFNRLLEDDSSMMDQKEMIGAIYYLLNFLNRAEELDQAKDSANSLAK